MHLAHETVHKEYDKHIPAEEITRRKAVLRKANTPPFDFTQMTPQDARDYTETVLSSEAGAWVEAIATYHGTLEKYGIDISDGMNAGEIMSSIHNCLGSYERTADSLKSSSQNNTTNHPTSS